MEEAQRKDKTFEGQREDKTYERQTKCSVLIVKKLQYSTNEYNTEIHQLPSLLKKHERNEPGKIIGRQIKIKYISFDKKKKLGEQIGSKTNDLREIEKIRIKSDNGPYYWLLRQESIRAIRADSSLKMMKRTD